MIKNLGFIKPPDAKMAPSNDRQLIERGWIQKRSCTGANLAVVYVPLIEMPALSFISVNTRLRQEKRKRYKFLNNCCCYTTFEFLGPPLSP